MARNYVEVLGEIWMPSTTAATIYEVSTYDVENMRNEEDGLIEREDIELWLCTHSGDFQSVTDFAAFIDGQDYPWADEENEWAFHDCMYPAED